MESVDVTALRAILDAQPEHIVRYRIADRRILFTNQAYAEMFQSVPEQLEGRSILGLFRAHAHAEVVRWIEGFTPVNAVRLHDSLVDRPDSEPTWYRWTDTAVFDDDGVAIEIQAVGRELTATEDLSANVQESELRFRLAFDHAAIGMALLDESGVVTRTNSALLALIRRPETDVIGAKATAFLTELPISTEGSTTIETSVRCGATTARWCWVTTTATDGADQLLQVVDIHDRKTAQDRLAEMAGSDSVTGLVNRRGLQDRLDDALKHAARQGSKVAVAFCDLDGFKLINDSLGHAAGDDLLNSVATRLVTTVRPEDTAARFGGDEFVLVLTDLSRTDDALAVTQRVLDALAKPHVINGAELTVGVSIGVSITDGDQTSDELLRAADAAMYRAKGSGLGQIQVSDRSLEVSLDAQTDLRADLEVAVRDDQMRLHYQPIVDAQGRAVAAEALLRWDRLGVGPVSPADFLPMLERSSLIATLGQRQLARACEEITALSTIVGRPLDLWFNVCLRQVVAPGFFAAMEDALSAAGIRPSRLCLELTEWSDLPDRSAALKVLGRLADRGVRVALDDFGTGYASMELLRDGPLTGLKIDRGFTAALADGAPRRERGLVKALIDMANALDLEIVVEGVETQTQFTRAVELGVPLLQGWHIGKARPPAQWSATI